MIRLATVIDTFATDFLTHYHDRLRPECVFRSIVTGDFAKV